MSKLNRREFKELLAEWRQSFINERGKYQSSFVKPEEDYLSTIRDEKGIILGKLLEYLDDKLSNNFNKYGRNLLYKNKKNIELIANFLNQAGYEKEASDIIKESSNNSALIITHDSGGALNLEGGEYLDTPEHVANRVGGKPDISWILHDFIHIFIEGGEIDEELYVFQDEALKNNFNSKMHMIDEYHYKYDLLHGGLYDMMDDEEKYDILVDVNEKFFNEINFTPGVEGIDAGTSALAYCWMKMKHKEDLAEVNNSVSLNDKEKKEIKEYFKKLFTMVTGSKNLVLESFKNTILIVPVLK